MQIKRYQAPTGTIIVLEEPPKGAHPISRVVMYARVSSHEHRTTWSDRCNGWKITSQVEAIRWVEIEEIAFGFNDARPKLLAWLKVPCLTKLVVEHKDRLTRFGFRFLETLLELKERSNKVVTLAEPDREEWLIDLVSIVYRFAAPSMDSEDPNVRSR